MVFKTKKTLFPAGAGIAEHFERPSVHAATAAPSVITAEMVVTGDLQSPGDVRIEGRVNGAISVSRLILAEGAAITGDVIADEVHICGTLHGTISGKMVTLTETGRVIGDIFHELLSIETGGQLEGRCHRLSANMAAGAEAKSAAAAPTPGTSAEAPKATATPPTAENAKDFAAVMETVLAEPEPPAKPQEPMPRIYANSRNRNAAA
jgi:cytoskeletal protein CcmA (bactofilin family)